MFINVYKYNLVFYRDGPKSLVLSWQMTLKILKKSIKCDLLSLKSLILKMHVHI